MAENTKSIFRLWVADFHVLSLLHSELSFVNLKFTSDKAILFAVRFIRREAEHSFLFPR